MGQKLTFNLCCSKLAVKSCFMGGRMKARYTRLVTDVNGASKFEDMEVELAKGFSVPPAEPLFNARFLMPEGATFWLGAPTDWKGIRLTPRHAA
jgi:hypothetical protein